MALRTHIIAYWLLLRRQPELHTGAKLSERLIYRVPVLLERHRRG